MDYSSASSYVYAKACGMLGKSFTGPDAQKLFDAKSLSDLWEMIFHSPAPQMPESMLANHLEYEAYRKLLREYTLLLSYYDKPHKFLIDILSVFEVENLKTIAASLSWGEQKCPRIIELNEYEKLHLEKWPDITAITADTPYAWYNHIPSQDERWEMDYRLDLQLLHDLWASLNRIKDSSKEPLYDFIRKEYSRKNMLWALRLKVYYKMSDEQIVKHLFYSGEKPCASDPLCGEAMDILNLEADAYDQWEDWKYAYCLNPHEDGVVWKINPMFVEQRLRLEETENERKLFHQYPMTDICLVMFFKLKQQELNCIRAAVEALRLHADRNDAMYAAGISADIR